jgi:hypothetical protein
MPFRPLALALCLLLPGVALADPPPVNGTWMLDREHSGNLEEAIKAAAGPATMSGAPGFARGVETWIPWTGGFDEPDRLTLREFLLATMPVFDKVEIEQAAAEVKTVHGESGVRRFSLARKTAGSSALGGEKVTRVARMEGARLLLESKGEEGELKESLSVGPEPGRLTYALRLEHKLLKAPLAVTLVYGRAPAQ